MNLCAFLGNFPEWRRLTFIPVLIPKDCQRHNLIELRKLSSGTRETLHQVHPVACTQPDDLNSISGT